MGLIYNLGMNDETRREEYDYTTEDGDLEIRVSQDSL